MAQQAIPYSYTEKKRIRKSFGKRESVLNVPYLLTMQKDSYVAFLQKDVPSAKAQARRACRRRSSPRSRSSRTTGYVEMKFIEFNMAKPAFDTRECQQRGLTYAAAVRAKLQMIIYDRESAQAKTVKEIKEQEVYMGEVPLDDRLRLVHRQRHRARDRLAAAPFAGRVLRARQGQDALERQAPVLGADHSLPRLVARLRVRPEGHPLLPRRPPPQDAGDDPAEGDRPESGSDPRQLLRLRQLPPDGHGRAARSSWPIACAARSPASTSPTRTATSSSRRTSASPRATCAQIETVRDQVHLGARGLPGRPRAGAQRRRCRHRRDPGQGQRRADRHGAEEAARRPASRKSRRSTPTSSTKAPTSRRRSRPTRPPTSSRRASPSTA